MLQAWVTKNLRRTWITFELKLIWNIHTVDAVDAMDPLQMNHQMDSSIL